MTIFKEIVDEEYLTTSEVKEELAVIEAERSGEDSPEMPYELARAIEHANRFGDLSTEDARALVDDLLELEKVSEATAYKIADLLPEDRAELRSIYAQERYSLSGDELDDVLNVVSQYV